MSARFHRVHTKRPASRLSFTLLFISVEMFLHPFVNFLVRKSRTSQRNVLCVRLADDSVPSFVQQFGIREEQCKFWSSHLNVRGPREAPKPQNTVDTSASPAAPPQTGSESTPQPDSAHQLKTEPESDTTTKPSGSNPTLFHEFCPITTRSPGELDCGSGLGAFCFINPLFLQSQNVLSRRRNFKHSLKVRVSTESSTLLSPPLAAPPPPPLMPKSKGSRKAKGHGGAQISKGLLQSGNPSQATARSDASAQDTQPLTQTQDAPSEAQMQPPSAAPHSQPEVQEQGQTPAPVEATDQLPTVVGHFQDDSEYMQPSLMINSSHPPSLSPYLSPAVAPRAPPLFPKAFPPLSPHSSPGVTPSLSPYQSSPVSPKVSFSLFPRDSPSDLPSLSPYQSPSPSPKVLSLSPFTSSPLSQLAEQAYHIPAAASRSERDVEEEGAAAGEIKDGDGETHEELHEEEEGGLVFQMNAGSLDDTDSRGSLNSLEEAAETHPTHTHDCH
ncbi:hypothetical protein F2P81_009016 [Scophthalmus maximus]|uniref:Uncharacterized protein n=1 Tax=Scophthalmus maximus TaxID=52904 RepID=A0A6A4T8Q2_SCOMX|nr:hypothetical protein F2P81_009016 [Scophthalmus maximus]